jgi:hypothetical protein
VTEPDRSGVDGGSVDWVLRFPRFYAALVGLGLSIGIGFALAPKFGALGVVVALLIGVCAYLCSWWAWREGGPLARRSHQLRG